MSYEKATAAPTQITDQIFLGSRRHAANLVADNPSAIGAVLNFGTGLYDHADLIEYKHIPLLDAGPISADDLGLHRLHSRPCEPRSPGARPLQRGEKQIGRDGYRLPAQHQAIGGLGRSLSFSEVQAGVRRRAGSDKSECSARGIK